MREEDILIAYMASKRLAAKKGEKYVVPYTGSNKKWEFSDEELNLLLDFKSYVSHWRIEPQPNFVQLGMNRCGDRLWVRFKDEFISTRIIDGPSDDLETNILFNVRRMLRWIDVFIPFSDLLISGWKEYHEKILNEIPEILKEIEELEKEL